MPARVTAPRRASLHGVLVRAATLALALIALLLAPAPREARADGKTTQLRVGVEREGDLRLLALWVGVGNGDFRRAGLEIVPVVLGPRAVEALRGGEVDVAAVGPALWAPAVLAAGAGANDDAAPALIAALLGNEDCNLVVRRAALPRRELLDAPLEARLSALEGLRVGQVGAPSWHLSKLLGAHAPRVNVVPLDESAADAAFARGEIDALYAPTPWAERALTGAEGSLLVHASREPTAGASPLVEAALVSRAFGRREEARVLAFVRALAAAEQLVHDERAAAVHALAEARPGVDRAQLETAVILYEPAVPSDPRLDAARVTASVRLERPSLDPSKLDVAVAIDAHFAERAVGSTPPPHRFMKIAGAVLGVVIGGIVTFMVLYRKKSEEAAGDA